jgi:hypothetical protein
MVSAKHGVRTVCIASRMARSPNAGCCPRTRTSSMTSGSDSAPCASPRDQLRHPPLARGTVSLPIGTVGDVTIRRKAGQAMSVLASDIFGLISPFQLPDLRSMVSAHVGAVPAAEGGPDVSKEVPRPPRSVAPAAARSRRRGTPAYHGRGPAMTGPGGRFGP